MQLVRSSLNFQINCMNIYDLIAAWNDTRTSTTVTSILSHIRNKKNILKPVCGLPLSNCFSAVKVKWITDNVPGVQELIQTNDCLFGTLDSWILWNLTGGIEGGVHVTDVTNAARTMLMNLETLKWDHKLCAFFRISPRILPDIKSCSEVYGFVHDGPLQGVPIAGVSVIPFKRAYFLTNSNFYVVFRRTTSVIAGSDVHSEQPSHVHI